MVRFGKVGSLVYVSLLLVNVGHAQESAYSAQESTVLRLNYAGKWQLSSTRHFKLSLLDSSDVLGSKLIHKELELSDDQRKELRRFLKQIDADENEFSKRIKLKATAEQLSEVSSKRSQVSDELGEILLPFQITRLKELQAGFGMRRHGFLKYLQEHREVDLELEDREKRAIREYVEKFHADYCNESRKLAEEVDKDLNRGFSVKQKASLSAAFGEDICGSEIIELLLFDLRKIERAADSQHAGPSAKPARDKDALFEPLYAMIGLRIGADGTWLQAEYPKNVQMNLAPGFITFLLRNKKEFGMLKLTSEQIEAIDEAWVTCIEKINEINRESRERQNSGAAAMAERIERHHLVESTKTKLQKRFESLLSPEQHAVLHSHFQRLSATSRGHFSEAIRGRAEIGLDLSRQQLAEAKKVARKAIDEIEEKLVDAEAEFFDGIRECLDDNSKQKLQQLTGVPPKFVIPNVFVLSSVPGN